MADTKISAMTPSSDIDLADVIPFVSAGANFKATKQDFLTGKTGQGMAVRASAGQGVALVDQGANGRVQVNDGANTVVKATTTVDIGNAGLPLAIQVSLTGQVVVRTAFTANAFDVLTGGGQIIKVDDMAGIVTITANTQCFVSYFAAVPGNWAGAPPATLGAAIDRLVAAVVARTIGGPV